MQGQFTIRLPEELEIGLEQAAKSMRIRRSDVVRIAVERFINESQGAQGRPYDRVKGLIGSYRSGVSDLGTNHREHLLKRLKRA